MVVQAMGGVMSLTGWPDQPPARVGTSFRGSRRGAIRRNRYRGGLYKRSKDAQGTHVDIAMLDCQAALMETAVCQARRRSEGAHEDWRCAPSLAPFESFAAQDGRIVIAAGNDQLFFAHGGRHGRTGTGARSAVPYQRSPRAKTGPP